MLITRAMALALIEQIKRPRDGSFVIRDKKLCLRDKLDGRYLPACFKNRVPAIMEEV